MGDRKHLVSAAIDKLMEAAKGSRNAARDRCLLLLRRFPEKTFLW